MATQSVATNLVDIAEGPRVKLGSLPLRTIDRTDELIIKAMAILDVIGKAAAADDPPAGEAIRDAVWAARDMVSEVNWLTFDALHPDSKGR